MSSLLPQLAVHGTHHKMGTVWIATALRDVAAEFDLKLQEAPHSLEHPPVDSNTDVYFDGHTRFDPTGLREFRGSHMVRDLRDVAVSGYHYHLWTQEPWANRPMNARQRARFGIDEHGPDTTYVELLNSQSREDGLLTEIRRLGPLCEQLRAWDFDDPRILEVHFEDMMENGDEHFRELFCWWGFDKHHADRASELVMRRHVSKIKDRGTVLPHVRSGKAQQWKSEFEPAHVDAARELFGDLLVEMRYETGLDW